MEELNVPEDLLDRAGLKKENLAGGRDVVVPKDVITRDEKFQELYRNIGGRLGISNAVNADQFVNLFSYYLTSVLESKVSERMARYDQMDFIVENEASLSMAEKVLTDEIMQADVFNKPITVTSPNLAFKQAIDKLFKELGVASLITETGRNLIRYGDGFWVLDVVKNLGVQSIIPIDPRDVKHRFEFSIADLQKQRTKLIRKYSGLQAIIELGSAINSGAANFRRVLLGFQILNSIFPFWQVLHFRKYTTRQTVFPFGKPFFYESQSEARMYLNAKVVTSMIRSSAFLKEHIKVKTSDTMDPAEQWQLVNEVKQMMELFISRSGRTNKDIPSFGEKLFYPQGLLEIEKQEGGFNFRDRYEDLQLMREDVFNSVGMPKEYFAGTSSVYVSAKSLMVQDKKTARMVFDLQRIIISQLIKLVEVHFSFTKEFDPYGEEYAISLPYPIPDIDDSMLNIQSSKLSYATSVVDSLKNMLGIVKIPEPVLIKLMRDSFSFSDEDIEALVKQMKKDTEAEETRGIDKYGAKYGDPYLTAKDQADLSMDQMKQQGDMMTQQGDLSNQQGQIGLQTAVQGVAQGDLAIKQQKLQLKQMKDQMTAQDQQMQGQAGQVPGEEQQGQGQEMTPEEQQAMVAQQQAQQQQPQENYPLDKNAIYEYLYRKAIQKHPIDEAFQRVAGQKLMEKGEEFVFMKRHYVANDFSSPDRNTQGVINLKEHIETAKKVVVTEEDKSVKLEGIDVLEDTSCDMRYMTKEEKTGKMGGRLPKEETSTKETSS